MASILPPATPAPALGQTDDEREIVQALGGYKAEAETARRSGLNPRDAKWEQNLALYWNRVDFSKKADWQAREVMPEVPSYVDRFAAAMKEALVAIPEGFYTVTSPGDVENDLAGAIKRMNDVWLSTVGRNAGGTPLGFPAVFEEQMKLGALTASSAVVLWKEDVKGGRVAIETVDPRFVWLDASYRDLYRIRRTEIDKHDLMAMARATTKGGKSLYNISAISGLVDNVNMRDIALREQMSGHGQQVSSNRSVITLDEYLATVVSADGRVLADKELMVVANDQFLIRGPEKNPFWHGQDWMVYAPLVTAPLSVYGRSYMEDFGAIANTFTELTNLILDAVQTSAMKAFVMVPGMLLNPLQASQGIHPNKVFLLEEGYQAEDFAKALDLGSLDPAAIQVWQSMKSELSEAAGINEIGLGQFAPKGRTSATEISATQSSSSALVRSVAQTIETRFLDPVLDLTWKTGLQHATADNKLLAGAAGTELYAALMGRRRELIGMPITFQAHGISTLIQKQQMLDSILGLLQVIGQNENLLAAFMQKIDVNKLIALLFNLGNVDLTKMQLSERERLMQGVLQPLQQAGAQVPGGEQQGAPAEATPGAQQMQEIAARMGIMRGE